LPKPGGLPDSVLGEPGRYDPPLVRATTTAATRRRVLTVVAKMPSTSAAVVFPLS
jgi:hypothetical protein